MTTVEAMQNFCVPIVIDGGGQREIVEHEESGFRFSTLEQLSDFSMCVIDDRERCQSMAERAFQRSHLFNHDVFRGNVERLLDEVEVQLMGRDMLPGAETSVH